MLFADRSVTIVSGHSVLPAHILMCAAFLVYAYFTLKRCYLAKQFSIHCPYPNTHSRVAKADDPGAPKSIRRIWQEIRTLAKESRADLVDMSLYISRHRGLVIVAAAGFIPVVLLVYGRVQPCWEGRLWDITFLIGFLSLAALVLVTILRLISGWRKVEKMLKLIALVPMVGAFDRLPRKTATLFGGYLFTRRPRRSHLNIPSHIFRQLQEESAKDPAKKGSVGSLISVSTSVSTDSIAGAPSAFVAGVYLPPESSDGIEPSVQNGEADKEFLERLPQETWETVNQEGPTDREYPRDPINKQMAAARRVLVQLERYWPSHTLADAFGEQTGTTASDKEGDDKKATMPSWVQKAEDFIAIQVIMFLSQYFILLRTTAYCMVWVSVLLFLAATAYPFEPEELLLYLLLGLFGTVIVATLWILIRINKTEIVSRITRSTPNKFDLNWTFMQAALQLVGPIAILALAQISGRLRIIVEPLLEVIR
jgi:hypothetical protein